MITCLSIANVHAAYLRNIPKTVNQPDGTVLHCFASGDEFFNYLHDSNGYTIIQHPQTGYYVYAQKRDGKLVATEYVVGIYDPASKGLEPYALISPEEWLARRKAWEIPEKRPQNHEKLPNHGTLNNLSIFIRFSDDKELSNSYSSIDNMFNNVSENAISMRSYFRAASYGAIEISTTFYPGHNGDDIISYQDTYPRSYYNPYSSTNPDGYQTDNERAEREFSLLERAVNYVNDNCPVPSDLDIDYDDDGYVDNVCFIVKGGVGEWSSLLWPHMWALQGKNVYINGKRVWTFNFQLADGAGYFETTVMCHEMNHSLGAPDLYHYYHGTNVSPVGGWDLMENNANPPQHCGAYMKMKYGHWIDEIPEITQAGVYTLNPISSSTPTNVAYKIATEDPNQYYVVEYRDNTSLFETSLPGSGLLVYRIDTRFGGNADYDPSNGIYDEVYIFRPGGSTSSNGNLYAAYFNYDEGRTEFSSSTSAYPFLTDGTIDNTFKIYDITRAGSTISFSYGSSSDCEPPTNLVATVENDNNVYLSWYPVNNAVSYNVYRGGNLIGSTDRTSYWDYNLDYGIYDYYVKSVDREGLLSTASETVSVSVMPEDSFLIGVDGSATNSFLPSYSYYNYSLTQQIYTAEELGEAGDINSIAFYNGGGGKTRTYDLYLKNTTKSTFSDGTDWETVSEADKVFSGTVTMTANAWTFFVFDTPFEYDGTSNLVLVVDDNSNSWSGSPHMSCRVFTAPNQALYSWDDNIDFDPMSPSTIAGSSGSGMLSVKNQLVVIKEVYGDCMKPIQLTATEVGPRFVKLSWMERGTSEEWVVVCNGNPVEADTNEDFILDGLDPETEYTITVRPACDENLISNSITVTTLEACPIPENVVVGDITGNRATVAWNGYDESYIVQLGIPAFMIGLNFDDEIPADWNNSSNNPWILLDGHIQSGNAGVANSTSSISATVDYPADGTIDFDAECKGEGYNTIWDKCVFSIDGVQQFSYGANMPGWNHYSYDVTAGEHTFTWLYSKDGSLDPDGDYFAIDNVELKAGQTDWDEPIVVSDTQHTFRGLSPVTTYFVRVQGTCDGTETDWSEIVFFTTTELTTITQAVVLTAGWNWFSPYVKLDDPIELLQMLKVGLGENAEMILSMDDGMTAFDGEEWFGELDDFGLANTQMYMILTNAACTVEMEGEPVNLTDYEISIKPGWNWIGFPSVEALDVVDALAGFAAEEGDILLSQDSGLTSYDGEEWFGDLETLEPGVGLMYYSSSSETKTLVYSTAAKGKGSVHLGKRK